MSLISRLKHLQNDQIEAASRVAFYYYPHPIERKIKTLPRCEYTILLGILSGEVYTIPSNIKGVAIWNTYGIKDQIIGEQSKEIIRKLLKEKCVQIEIRKKIDNKKDVILNYAKAF